MKCAERTKVNVLEMMCLRSLIGVSRLDRVRNDEVRRRAGIEKELASRADQRVMRLFWHGERMDENRMARRMSMAEVSSRTCTRETEVRLDGWCEGGLGQQRNDCGGCATMRERSDGVESPVTFVTE